MEICKFHDFTDERGSLVPISLDNLGFVARRLFYVVGVPKGATRGGHAHQKTRQILVCLQGLILVELFDGKETERAHLHPLEYVEVKPMTWDSQTFLTGNEVLLVICSTQFDERDYIRDRDEFIRRSSRV
jgi:dTDP-4-dehydrorhamnose 3,5-epimerase-like enzyme